LTAVGPVIVRRTYFACPTCGQGDFGADRVLGIDGYVTAAACRMACLVGVQQSFAKAQRTLAEVAGWQLDDNTLRKLCHATAARATAGRAERATADTFAQAQADAQASVDVELQLDAGKANTREGWRDVKVAVFACRERGVPTTVADWDERELPAPGVRTVVAAVEEASVFGERCAQEATRLELDLATLSVRGDGAEWLWNLRQQHFPESDQLLDFWHGAEHLAAAAQAVCDAAGGEADRLTNRGKIRLLEDGYWGVTEWVGEVAAVAQGGDGAALGEVLNYFCGHQERLQYALHLRRGQSLGSGLVEGTIKQLLNKRVKQTGARWKVEHVGPFVELGALAAGPEWQAFWEQN
jgi:hypothetical protein